LELGGKYRLICELGEGGMAVVHLAVALGASNFRKLAVVKIIRPQIASDPDMIEMFFDEARLSARLNHPNIVQTYDVGVSDGHHFMAMEYLEGAPLSAIVSQVKPDFQSRAHVLLDVLEGLHYAHELKDYDGTPLDIVHRDISPHNVFVTYSGHVKVLDFGIAKATTSSVQTATGVVKGKLKYMAPEQALGQGTDGRADLFAVGVMLWEAMTGRRRFARDISDVAVYTRVASGEIPETPDATSLGYPAELSDIIKKALAPKPQERFQTAGEFRAELAAALGKMGPCSLRALGASAAQAFAEQREKINSLLEQRLRQIDDGTEAPDMTQQLPTVRPIRGTWSSSTAGPLAVVAAGIDPVASGSTPHSGTQRGGITRPLSSPVQAGMLRRRLAAAAVALAVALGLMYVSRVHRTDGDGPASTRATSAAATPIPTIASAAPAVAEAEKPLFERPGVAPSGSERPPAPASRALGSRPRKPSAVTAPSASEGTTSAPAASGSAQPVDPNLDVAPRVAPRGPKVQLERDNPWSN